MKLDSSILTKSCQLADFNSPAKNLRTAHELIRLMKKERGMGLAANQAGIDLRLFVMKIADRYYHCFNPEILSSSKNHITLDEGCLSFPDQTCALSRPESIVVRYYSAYGTATEETLSGWASRCFQHELDHLNGLTMFDREK